jgi:NAD(P)-dependent dehydrogenase (short-subunit alcohol dehydrogenase family)
MDADGASCGLGREIVKAALAAGHNVVATSRSGKLNGEGLPEDRLLVAALNVTTQEGEAYSSVVESAVARFGRIDVLVNNAGYGDLTKFEEAADSKIRDIFETNVFGRMRVTRAVVPVMRGQGSGHGFNVFSAAGYTAGPTLYHASKWAVNGFTESLTFEISAFGIEATNVVPGFFRTDFLDGSSMRMDPAVEIADYDSSRDLVRWFIDRMNHE